MWSHLFSYRMSLAGAPEIGVVVPTKIFCLRPSRTTFFVFIGTGKYCICLRPSGARSSICQRVQYRQNAKYEVLQKLVKQNVNLASVP